MMKKTQFIVLILTIVLALSACNLVGNTIGSNGNQPVFNRDADQSYSAEFRIQFSGSINWSYQLKTKKTATQREISLHIEGLKGLQNPGDIRMVTDDTTTWMTGAGTDNQCVEFPNGQGMDPTFLYPESLVTLNSLGNALQLEGEEKLSGIAVLHFHAAGVTTGPWKDATIDLWQDKDTSMLRQFTMTGTGDDPFFKTGSGKLVAGYIALPLGNATIEPVTGCEISVPLPDAISMFVRLPGLASFNSKSSVDELVKFYQTSLLKQNWTEKDPLAQSQDGGTVLSYQRGQESVEIHIQQNQGGGSAVKLMFITGQ